MIVISTSSGLTPGRDAVTTRRRRSRTCPAPDSAARHRAAAGGFRVGHTLSSNRRSIASRSDIRSLKGSQRTTRHLFSSYDFLCCSSICKDGLDAGHVDTLPGQLGNVTSTRRYRHQRRAGCACPGGPAQSNPAAHMHAVYAAGRRPGGQPRSSCSSGFPSLSAIVAAPLGLRRLHGSSAASSRSRASAV